MHQYHRLLERLPELFSPDHQRLAVGFYPDDSLLPVLPCFHTFWCDNLLSENWVRANRPQALLCRNLSNLSVTETESEPLVLMHKSKKRMFFWLYQLQQAGMSQVFLLGHKKSGVVSLAKTLKREGGEVTKLDSAGHASLFQVELPVLGEKLFEVPPYTVEVPGSSLTLQSLPGVFSADRLDEGTALLLSFLDKQPLQGSVLDLCCGNGVIGLSVARRFHEQTTVTAVDCDFLAIESARANAIEAGVEMTCLVSDGFSEVEATFDWILCNPPFHQGTETDYRFVQLLAEEASRYLKPGGRLLLVANRFLPYEDLLKQAFAHVSLPLQADGFKLVQASIS